MANYIVTGHKLEDNKKVYLTSQNKWAVSKQFAHIFNRAADALLVQSLIIANPEKLVKCPAVVEA